MFARCRQVGNAVERLRRRALSTLERLLCTSTLWPVDHSSACNHLLLTTGSLQRLASQLQLSVDRDGPLRPMSQRGALVMTILSQIQNAGLPRYNVSRSTTVEGLVAALRRAEHVLRENIEAEEHRTCLRDQNDPCYSTLARSMRSRAENLQKTIAMLEPAQTVAWIRICSVERSNEPRWTAPQVSCRMVVASYRAATSSISLETARASTLGNWRINLPFLLISRSITSGLSGARV